MKKLYKTSLPPGKRQIWGRKYLAGKSLKNLGLEYGVSHEAIRIELLRMGISLKPRGLGHHVSDAERSRWEREGRAGKSPPQIARGARGTKHSVGAIRRHLKRSGIAIQYRYREGTIGQRAYEMRLQGITWREIAERLNVSNSQMAFNQAYNFAHRKRDPSPWPISYPQAQRCDKAWRHCAKLHQSGKSITDIARKYQVAPSTIRRYLIAQEIPVVDSRPAKIRTDWAEKYQAGFSMQEIAKESGVSESSVARGLRRQNIPIRSREHSKRLRKQRRSKS